MIELIDTSPRVAVLPAEYQRLLGFPPGFVMAGRTSELAAWAGDWYSANGRPWMYAREAESLTMAGATVGFNEIGINSVPFFSDLLRRRFEQAGAHAVVLAAVSAGPEIEHQAQKLWLEEKPDEYYFLDVFGSAVVEQLTTMAGARLSAWADGNGMAVLPHYSPGYPQWEVAEQRRLRGLLGRLPGELAALDSGALRPKKSLLAVFGLTRHTARVRRLAELAPCAHCSLAGCQFRRTPLKAETEYGVNVRALKKWAEERLSLQRCDDGTVEAQFRYEGTTCTNMGRALTFQYTVTLGPREAGYPIRAQQCAPDPSDTGHRYMCQYTEAPERLMSAIDGEKPLLGRPLDEVLAWSRRPSSAGCYCEPASRRHKWGLVLETIHYALDRQDTGK